MSSDLDRDRQEATIRWRVVERDLPIDHWRPRLLADDAADRGWLGGSLRDTRDRRLLWRLDDDGARSVELPSPAARAFVLEGDGAGGLWVAAYDPVDTATYDRLTIRHRGRDGVWSEERVGPGLWPQAMARARDGTLWIGGNHALLLRRAPPREPSVDEARWRRERVELLAGLGDGDGTDVNVLDLRLGRGDGELEGVLVGAHGLVAQLITGSDGDRWRQLAVPEPLRGRQLYAVDLTSDGAAWTVTSDGTIARWHPVDGWHVDRVGTADRGPLFGLDMVDPERGWAVGPAGTILERRDGAWRRVASPVEIDLYDVRVGGGRGWIAGHRILLRGEPGDRADRPAALLAERTPGLLARVAARDVTIVDLDADRDLDLMFADDVGLRIFRRTDDGFETGPVLPVSSGPQADRDGVPASWAVGDMDGDGLPDVAAIVDRASDAVGEILLFHNRGGRFVESSRRAGLSPVRGRHAAPSWVDFDADGDLDLYVAIRSRALAGRQPDVVFTNDGVGRFTPRTVAMGDVTMENLVLWGDLDDDGDADAVVPGHYADETRLYRLDRGEPRDVTRAAALAVHAGRPWTGALADLDRDGDLDLVAVGEQLEIHRSEIHRSEPAGEGPRLSLAARLAAPLADAHAVFCRVGDLDLDGIPEILVHWRSVDGAATVLAERTEGGVWRWGPGLLALGRFDDGAFADLDGDGALDVLLTGTEGTVLLESRPPPSRRPPSSWLKLRLHGDRGATRGASAFASTEAHDRTSDGANGALLVRAEHAGAGTETLLGLGAHRGPVDLEVRLPGGRTIRRHGVEPGTVVDLHDTALPRRLAARAERAVARRVPWLEPWREGLKLGALGLLLAVVAAPARGSDRRERPKAPTTAAALGVVALAAVHGVASLTLAPVDAPLAHVAQVAGVGGLAGAFVVHGRRRAASHLGPYRLGPVLGRGASGVVHRARHVVAGRPVALKVLHPHQPRDAAERLRFVREARLGASVEHPAIVRVHDAGEADGRAYLAMELLEGITLSEHLERRGPLAPAAWRSVAVTLAGALEALHAAGVVHRDVKCENVFVLREPSAAWPERLRLMDLGLAWSRHEASLTRSSERIGTIATMAPERLAGDPAAGPGDWWSLGAVLHEAATGRPPFAAESAGALMRAILDAEPPPLDRPDLGPGGERLTRALLDRDPSRRPSSVAAVRRILDEAPGLLAIRVDPRTDRSSDADGSVPEDAESPWRARRRAVLAHLDAGRPSHADLELIACLRDLRARAAALEPDRRVAFLERAEIRSILELSTRLERESP